MKDWGNTQGVFLAKKLLFNGWILNTENPTGKILERRHEDIWHFLNDLEWPFESLNEQIIKRF